MEYAIARILIAAVLFVAILALALAFRGRLQTVWGGRLAVAFDALVAVTAALVVAAAWDAVMHYLA
jgi:hypothetical protein